MKISESCKYQWHEWAQNFQTLVIKESNVEIRRNGSYLHFRNGRDDGGFGLNVSQIHGSGEQQQRRRNVLIQVQVQPLSVGHFLLLHFPPIYFVQKERIAWKPSLKTKCRQDNLIVIRTVLTCCICRRSCSVVRPRDLIPRLRHAAWSSDTLIAATPSAAIICDMGQRQRRQL